MSKIEENVIQKIRNRAAVGKRKYGVTMEREDLSLHEWLQHLQDELMDAAVYTQKLIEEVRDINEERDLRNYDEDALEDRMKHIGQNGNDGLHYAQGYGPCSAHALYDEEVENNSSTTSTMYPGDIEITYDIVKP